MLSSPSADLVIMTTNNKVQNAMLKQHGRCTRHILLCSSYTPAAAASCCSHRPLLRLQLHASTAAALNSDLLLMVLCSAAS
jgi:hypothetical protein